MPARNVVFRLKRHHADARESRQSQSLSGLLSRKETPVKTSDREERVEHTPRASSTWTKQDYDHSAAIGTVVERIVKRVAENAVRLAIVRHDLENDTELTAEEIVKDVLGVVMGEDASCDPDDDESVEILWAEKELRETLKEYPPKNAEREALVSALRAILDLTHNATGGMHGEIYDIARAALQLTQETK
jgi:hypothetical protein